jgi:hypothetical protein
MTKQPGLTHEQLRAMNLTQLAHECSIAPCAGGYLWLAWKELESASRYALHSGKLPVEAEIMMKAALHKLDTLKDTV